MANTVEREPLDPLHSQPATSKSLLIDPAKTELTEAQF